MTSRERAHKTFEKCPHNDSGACIDCIAAAIDAAVRDERERCAKVAEDFHCEQQLDAGELIAAAIREGRG